MRTEAISIEDCPLSCATSMQGLKITRGSHPVFMFFKVSAQGIFQAGVSSSGTPF